jgi:hypothetical protein
MSQIPAAAEIDGHCKYVAKPMGVPRIPAEILRRAAAGGSANPFKGAMLKAKPAGSQADRAAQKVCGGSVQGV